MFASTPLTLVVVPTCIRRSKCGWRKPPGAKPRNERFREPQSGRCSASAATLTGGLLLSEFLTLYLTPVVYLRLERLGGGQHLQAFRLSPVCN
jgi:hypothetical protein